MTLSEQENEYLKELTEDGVRHSTKGTVAYEILCMYTELTADKFDEMEEMADEQLQKAGIEFEEEFDEEYRFEDDESEREQRVMFLPPAFKSQLDDLDGYLSTILSDCLDKYSRSEYDDRAERIDAKREVLTEGISVSQTNPEASEEPEEEEETEYTHEHLGDYEYHAEEVKQTTQARVDYLQEYIDRLGEEAPTKYPVSREEVFNLAKNFYFCVDETAENYADLVDLDQSVVDMKEGREWIEDDYVQFNIESTLEKGKSKLDDYTQDIDMYKKHAELLSVEYDVYVRVEDGDYYLVHDPEKTGVVEA